MSKKTTSGDRPFLERLTNEEFLRISQHLSLDQYVLTEVFIPKKKWIRLLDANMQTLQAKCCVCDKYIPFEEVKVHIKQNYHLMLLRSNVKQLYHPFYTYGKIDIKLAKGEDTLHDLRQNALHDVNMQIKNFRNEYSFAKQFSESAERRSRAFEEDQLIEASLGKRIHSPDDMVVIANLPFEHISKLLFCVVDNEWQRVCNYKSLTRKTTFYCKICSTSCSGIETLNSHLYGYVHNLRQLGLYALCYEDSLRVNKNCCIQFGDSFSFAIKDCAKNFFRNREKNECEAQISMLPSEVAKKFKLLNAQAMKIFECPESNMHRGCMNEGDVSFDSTDSLGHLGVEYVLKIMKNGNDRDPKFECGLCEVFGDANIMQRHILYFDHKKKYLDLHYCDTIKKYEILIGDMMSYSEFLAVMKEIVHKVAIEIENHHGRSLPYTVSLADYKSRRRDLITEVYALLHASQIRGPSFSNIVSKEQIRYLKQSAQQLASRETPEYQGHILFTVPPKSKVYLNQMSHDPVTRLREYNTKFKTNRPLRTSRSISPIHAKSNDFQFERSDATVHKERTRSRSPPVHERTREYTRPSNQDIWDVYRREIALAANKIEIAYESFRINPESHPFYEDEWNRFWQRRKKELEREGYDHRSYNFQPEWVQYFKQRIEVLFGEALHKSQIDVRRRLNIPLDAEEDCQRTAKVTNQRTMHNQKRRSGKEDERSTTFEEHLRQRSPDYRRYDLPNKRMFLDQKKDNSNSDKSEMMISKLDDNHSNVIHVLRLMTALEEHLGSLGGKIMDLLSNALQLEKYYSGDSNKFEKKVLTRENCNLIETAVEKLKGILFAGLLDEKKLSGFNRVITYTTNLLNYAEKMGWRQENDLFEKKHFHVRDQHFSIQGETNSKQAAEKALSDTLMDLAKAPQNTSRQNYDNRLKEQDCPPPPSLQDTTLKSSSHAGFQAHMPNSGLASFDTKLSFNEAHFSRIDRRDLPVQTEIGQFQRKIVSGGNNLYNNSFKNNNETRTNNDSRTNNGTSSQFLISKINPKMGQNNIYQGLDGGNRKNWPQWN